MADVAEAPAPAGSLAELRDRHLDLLEQWSPDRAEALAPRAEALRLDAQALGGWLDEPDERDRAQGIIDYWTAALTGLPKRAFPEILRLDPFDPALPAGEVARAEALLKGHAGTAVEADLEEMLLGLVRPGQEGELVCRAPVERADLIAAGGGTDVERQTALLDQLVDIGIIRRSADPSGGEDRYAFTHGSTARACPRLHALVDKRRHMYATRDKLRSTAQLWKDSGDSGYLLAGDALGDAAKYLGEDPLLTEFIRVSRRAADRRRLQWLAMSAFLFLGIIGATAIAFRVGSSSGFAVGNEQGFIEGNVVGFDKAVVEQEEVVQGDAPPPARDAPVTLDSEGRGLSGWIWAGSPDQPQLLDAETRRPVNPADLVVNRRYRAGTNLWLRAAQPTAAGEAAERVSVVPQTGLVIVREQLNPIERRSGPQYWVRVGVVPRVFIQHVNGNPAQVQRLRDALVVAGFEAPPAELRREARNLHQVRFFRPEHREIAAFLASRLAMNYSGADGSPVVITCVRPKASPNAVNLEIWLDFESLRISPPSRAAPEPQCI